MKVVKQLLSFFLTALSVSVSGVAGQRAKPEISPVSPVWDAGNALSIAFIILPWATAGLSIGSVAYFLTHPHALNPRLERIPSGIVGRQTEAVWPFIGAMTLMAGVGFGAAVVLPTPAFSKCLRAIGIPEKHSSDA
jgi:hypothetical protein